MIINKGFTLQEYKEGKKRMNRIDWSIVAFITIVSIFLLIGFASATELTWKANALNEDGTECTDLAGFKVYSGLDPETLKDETPVDVGNATSYTVSMEECVRYYGVTAYDTSNNESEMSTIKAVFNMIVVFE